MSLATWWYEDPRPELVPLEGLAVCSSEDDALLANMARLPLAEIAARRAAGHRPYIAYLEGTPAAYGWVATRVASIGELELTVTLPAGNRYLWDFATLPAFRGRGVYPHLLAEIARRESPPATRLWIIHAPENLPSGIGISRAGFQPVTELSFDPDGRPALAPLVEGPRLAAAAALLGLPLVEAALAPCWGCGGCSCEHDEAGRCPCAIEPHR